MKFRLLFSILCLAASAGFAQSSGEVVGPIDSTAKTGPLQDGAQLVVTGQLVRPWGAQTYLPARPVDLALNSRQSMVAVLNSKSIDVLDANTGAVRQSFNCRATSYGGVSFRPGSDEIWGSEASEKGGDGLCIGNSAKADTPAEIKLPQGSIPVGIAFSRDGNTAYVALNGRNSMLVIDARDRRQSGRLRWDLLRSASFFPRMRTAFLFRIAEAAVRLSWRQMQKPDLF
jgi:DNA-binding beta-propeller fold protein YncE